MVSNRYKKLLTVLMLLFFTACAGKTISPENQYKTAMIPVPMKETYKLIRPCLIKFNYQIVDMDITVGAIRAVSKRNKNKHLYVTVSAAEKNQSRVKLKLDVRKHGMTGEYKRMPVPEKFMAELDGILLEIKRRAAMLQ